MPLGHSCGGSWGRWGMSEDFTDAQLAGLANITMGQSPGSDGYNKEEQGLPFLQGCAEFGPRHPHPVIYCYPPLRIAKRGSILVSVRAPVGTMNEADQKYCIGRGLAAIYGIAGVADTSFLHYAIEQNAGFLHRRSQGSTFLAIGGDDLRRLPLPKLDIRIQQRISEVLESVDDAIEKTESLIAKYQQIKAGLMHDLFTRGVTADGKLRPPREHAPELYKETPIGWIPKEWSVVCARQVVLPVTKGTTPTQMFATDASSSVPFIRVQNLSFDGSLIFDEDTLFVSLSTHRVELSRSIVLPGDILMNIVGPPLGKISVVPNTYPEWNINQAIAIFRPREQKILDFLRHYLLSRFAQHWFLLRAKQTSGQVNITLEMCNALPIPWPIHDEERRAISDKLNAADRKIQSEQKLHSKLQKQKAGLMHDLLTGKVRVTAA